MAFQPGAAAGGAASGALAGSAFGPVGAIGGGLLGGLAGGFGGGSGGGDVFPGILDTTGRAVKFGQNAFLANQFPVASEFQLAAIAPFLAQQFGIDPNELSQLVRIKGQVTDAPFANIPERQFSPLDTAATQAMEKFVGFTPGQEGLNIQTPFGGQANIFQNALQNLSLGRTFDPFSLSTGSLDAPFGQQGVGQQTPQAPRSFAELVNFEQTRPTQQAGGQLDVLTGGRLPTAKDIPQQAGAEIPTFGQISGQAPTSTGFATQATREAPTATGTVSQAQKQLPSLSGIAGQAPTAGGIAEQTAFGGLQNLIGGGGAVGSQLGNLISGDISNIFNPDVNAAFKQAQLEQFDVNAKRQQEQLTENLNLTGALRSSGGARQFEDFAGDTLRQRTQLGTGIDFKQLQRQQDFQNLAQNRSLQALGLGAGFTGQDIGRQIGAAGQDVNRALSLGQLGTQQALGLGQLGLGGVGQDVSRALGLGQLGVGAAGQDVNRALGLGGFGLQRGLGLGQLGLSATQQDVNRGLGLGQLGLGAGGLINQQNRTNLGLLENLGNQSLRASGLDFQAQQNLLNQALNLGQAQTQISDPYTQFQSGLGSLGLLGGVGGANPFAGAVTGQAGLNQSQSLANQQNLGSFFGGLTQFGLSNLLSQQGGGGAQTGSGFFGSNPQGAGFA